MIESAGTLDSVQIALVKAPKPFYTQLTIFDFAMIIGISVLGFLNFKRKNRYNKDILIIKQKVME